MPIPNIQLLLFHSISSTINCTEFFWFKYFLFIKIGKTSNEVGKWQICPDENSETIRSDLLNFFVDRFSEDSKIYIEFSKILTGNAFTALLKFMWSLMTIHSLYWSVFPLRIWYFSFLIKIFCFWNGCRTQLWAKWTCFRPFPLYSENEQTILSYWIKELCVKRACSVNYIDTLSHNVLNLKKNSICNDSYL